MANDPHRRPLVYSSSSIAPRSAHEFDDDSPTELVERPFGSDEGEAELVEVEGAPSATPRPARVTRWSVPPAQPDLATLQESRMEESRMSSEDPRELARRLAEQAKSRLAAPASEPDDDGDAFVMDEPPEPEIVIALGPPVAERAGSGPGRTMSALDALNAARERERTAGGRSAVAPPAPPLAPPLAPRPAAAHEPALAPPPAPAAPSGGPATVVAEAFPGAVIRSTQPVANAEVFRAVWRAHRNRAVHARDTALLSTASVLLDAIDRVPRGLLLACSVEAGADRYAVWIDAQRGALLAVATPPEIYLIG